AISESLQSSLRISRSQLINQELTIRPEANIESNVPEGLDLFKVIYEVESDTDTRMGDTVDGASVQNIPVKSQHSRHYPVLLAISLQRLPVREC
ncbi:jg25893, partial [Pararge aegeria aegeria]